MHDKRSWPRVAGLPKQNTDPLFNPPELPSSESDERATDSETEVAVFWHLSSYKGESWGGLDHASKPSSAFFH